jgi:lipoprotein NlpI
MTPMRPLSDQREPDPRGTHRTLAWLAGVLLAGGISGFGADANVDDLLNQAQAASLKGDRSNALALVNQAIEAAPTNAQCFYVRGRIYASLGEHTNALANLDKVLQMEPRAAQGYEFRALERLRLGRFTEAVEDFDKYLERAPRVAPFLWQRGVALYFAQRYAEARKQFELHHLVNSNDVENAAWHFAAVARDQGVAAARATLFRDLKDRRVPMAQIHGLLKGTVTPDEVLLTARAGRLPKQELRQRLFLAHLYIGLYYEASGQPGLAREHILTAASDYAPPTYIGGVAQMHADLYRNKLR